jgi:hypothetical protein
MPVLRHRGALEAAGGDKKGLPEGSP